MNLEDTSNHLSTRDKLFAYITKDYSFDTEGKMHYTDKFRVIICRGSKFVHSEIYDSYSDAFNRISKINNQQQHKHICDVCNKEITADDFKNDNYFEVGNDTCREDYCDYRHAICQQQIDEDAAIDDE